jgi:hypothetical protein
MQEIDDDRFLTARQARAALQVGPAKLRSLIRTSELRAVRLGRRSLRIPASSIHDLLRRGVLAERSGLEVVVGASVACTPGFLAITLAFNLHNGTVLALPAGDDPRALALLTREAMQTLLGSPDLLARACRGAAAADGEPAW